MALGLPTSTKTYLVDLLQWEIKENDRLIHLGGGGGDGLIAARDRMLEHLKAVQNADELESEPLITEDAYDTISRCLTIAAAAASYLEVRSEPAFTRSERTAYLNKLIEACEDPPLTRPEHDEARAQLIALHKVLYPMWKGVTNGTDH